VCARARARLCVCVCVRACACACVCEFDLLHTEVPGERQLAAAAPMRGEAGHGNRGTWRYLGEERVLPCFFFSTPLLISVALPRADNGTRTGSVAFAVGRNLLSICLEVAAVFLGNCVYCVACVCVSLCERWGVRERGVDERVCACKRSRLVQSTATGHRTAHHVQVVSTHSNK
jgi:hypothetical protein